MTAAGKRRSWCDLRRIPAMEREASHEVWAPDEGAWSLWARPTLFGQIPVSTRPFGSALSEMRAEQPWLNVPLGWAPPPAENAALILDLPEAEAVHLGLALAGRGYRPVPLYNGCTGPSELIDQGPILRA